MNTEAPIKESYIKNEQTTTKIRQYTDRDTNNKAKLKAKINTTNIQNLTEMKTEATIKGKL